MFPWHIPETDCNAAKVNTFPFPDIFETLLKIGVVLSSSKNDITESVLIPTLPEKLLFALVAAVPTTLIISDAEKYGNIRSYNTVSAKNVAIPVELDKSWRIDFISSVVNDTISLIDGASVVGLSLNSNCSPMINVPVVWLKQSSFTPVASRFLARYPIAPLLRPLTLVPWTLVPLVMVEFIALVFKIVNVWISYKCKS